MTTPLTRADRELESLADEEMGKGLIFIIMLGVLIIGIAGVAFMILCHPIRTSGLIMEKSLGFPAILVRMMQVFVGIALFALILYFVLCFTAVATID